MIFSPFGLCMPLYVYIEGNVASKHGGEGIFLHVAFEIRHVLLMYQWTLD